MRVLALLLATTVTLTAADSMTPVAAYKGTWKVSRKGADKPDTLVNTCVKMDVFYTCSQNINGQPGALIVFIQHGDANHYQVRNILKDAQATPLTELTINGDTWTWFTREHDQGVTTYYKTINVFSGKNKIHFESSHSSNDKDYTTDMSGDEVRISQ